MEVFGIGWVRWMSLKMMSVSGIFLKKYRPSILIFLPWIHGFSGKWRHSWKVTILLEGPIFDFHDYDYERKCNLWWKHHPKFTHQACWFPSSNSHIKHMFNCKVSMVSSRVFFCCQDSVNRFDNLVQGCLTGQLEFFPIFFTPPKICIDTKNDDVMVWKMKTPASKFRGGGYNFIIHWNGTFLFSSKTDPR